MTVDDPSATRFETVAGLGTRASPVTPFDEGGFTPGTVLQDRYRVVGLIGRGGMGEVYRAQDLKLGQAVALKFLPPDVGRDPARLEAFLTEVRIARQISHPHVCRVYDVGETGGRHFLSMEFVDGEDLASLLRRIGRLPSDKGVEVARQLCAGLAAAHDRGVLHRDLKPANIMIDGRGQARLADFGLAAAGAEVRPGEIAGTPAYMAPEQLAGQPLTIKTDIYALGLVLHELFTGKRVFDGASLQELREQHRLRSSSRAATTSGAFELDPAIERVIARCLEPDPLNRPPSALAVAAAFPGGDPLAAALAAGETPSPELVAESGAAGTLTPLVAWALAAALVLGLVGVAWLADRLRAYRLLPDMRSPEVLAARAEDMLDAWGYGGARGDSAYGWRLYPALIDYVRENDPRPDRWERLARADTPAVNFWYRQSPQPLVPIDSAGPVRAEDPPLTTPGMATIVLSPRGRLVTLRAVPPRQRASPPAGAPAADWGRLFEAAGIDATTLTAVEPRRTPSVYADQLAAWEGPHPDRREWTLFVEGASYRGQVVWFDVLGPWERTTVQSAGAGGAGDLFGAAARAIQVGIGVIALVAGAWLARRNMRSGRADRRGATIVAACVGVSLTLSGICGTHYAGSMQTIWSRFTAQLAVTLYWTVVVWLDYLALEPFVRRRWPEAMISWTRLLAGRFGDPLVARDVLIGCTAGLVTILLGDAVALLPTWAGEPPAEPLGTFAMMRSLGPVGLFAAEIARRPARILLESLALLFVIVLAHAILRNRWAGNLTVSAMWVAMVIDRSAVLTSAVAGFTLMALLLTLISRVGVLAYVAAWLVIFSVLDLPLSLDSTAWYAGRSAITAGMILAVAGWGFYRSLGGASPFGKTFEA